jgi:hypothetical protein
MTGSSVQKTTGMDDEPQTTYRDIYNRRVKQEYLAFENDPLAQALAETDCQWTIELNRRAEEAYRRSRPDEIPERGEYSPIARYERETGRR